MPAVLPPSTMCRCSAQSRSFLLGPDGPAGGDPALRRSYWATGEPGPNKIRITEVSTLPRLSHLCGWGLPGQADGADFCGCQLVSARQPEFRGDQDTPQLGGHAGGRWPGLGDIPGRACPVLIDVGGVVTGGGVPEDGQGLAGQGERDGGADRAGGAVAGLPGAEDLLRILDRDLDGLITNGKFCCVRRVQLGLTWWRRPLRLRRSALHTDVALVGEPDDPDLDRLPPVQPAPGRRAPVGSGRPAAGASGRAGRPARPDADR